MAWSKPDKYGMDAVDMEVYPIVRYLGQSRNEVMGWPASVRRAYIKRYSAEIRAETEALKGNSKTLSRRGRS
jgi:hypothetical protein